VRRRPGNSCSLNLQQDMPIAIFLTKTSARIARHVRAAKFQPSGVAVSGPMVRADRVALRDLEKLMQMSTPESQLPNGRIMAESGRARIFLEAAFPLPRSANPAYGFPAHAGRR